MTYKKATDAFEVERRIQEWHQSDVATVPIHEWLGWTFEEYKNYVEFGDVPGVNEVNMEKAPEQLK